MGEGRFSEPTYTEATITRSRLGVSDFAYTETATKIHDSLDPKRIASKPFRVLESRDSVGNPISTPIIVTFDVTGSNYSNAVVVQKKLPELMAKLQAVIENPQVAIWANDDTTVSHGNAIQLGEFESDNRIDEAIRNTWLVGRGGSNDGESYDLLLYAAARKVITDSWEKRHKKGYMFLYADEPFFKQVSQKDIIEIFGDGAQADIPIENIIEEVQQKWNIYLLWPQTGYAHARAQYVKLFGAENVIDVQGPDHLCDRIVSEVVAEEQRLQANATAATANSDFEYSSRAV